jgi:hypothetical protein
MRLKSWPKILQIWIISSHSCRGRFSISQLCPAGQLKQEQFGASTPIYNKLFYNSRQQLAEIVASTTDGDSSCNGGKIINLIMIFGAGFYIGRVSKKE